MDAIPITKKLIAFGSKKIYLPKFTVALVRTPGLSPYHARFLVPLDFSKYDLRDYLYHAYNVRCFNIRSYVKQMPVRDTREQPRHFFRPDSKKYMTVEMEQPFVWPEVESLEPWSQKERKEEVDRATETNAVPTAEEVRSHARTVRNRVKKLLQITPLSDKSIKKKDAEGLELNAEDQQNEGKRTSQADGVSRLRVWELARNGKVVQGDEADKYTIKA
ncbi:hypothetical protein IQ07DRAFT_621385 [Pyrenochaeta sp. DS3sAY3a]|nr:hypothetical protein IQ07DRAFT_621385 [Pyrenochaeta sp. DS3sAY3a]